LPDKKAALILIRASAQPEQNSAESRQKLNWRVYLISKESIISGRKTVKKITGLKRLGFRATPGV
jgi:hypothetical protein